MRKRNYFFYAVLLSPAVLLLVITGITLFDIVEINRIDPAAVYQDFRDALPRRQPWSFDMPPDVPAGDHTRKNVFVFGESSVLLSDGKPFPYYLEQNHRGLRVVNFGVSAIDSLTVRQRVKEALALERPDVIVLYYGHNDYNVAYHAYLLPKYFDQFDLVLRTAYVFSRTSYPLTMFADQNYYTFARLQRPKFFNLFQRMGLLTVRQQDYEPINQLILEQFRHNNEFILAMAASMHIPVVLITPIGNLHAEPCGDINTTTSFYVKGINTRDYAQSISLLKKARDTELITYDLRAKSPLVNYIRNIKQKNVYVLDLEKQLEARRFGFGNDDFVDYFHFKDRSHRLLADIIYDFMKQNNLIRSE